MKVQKFQRNVIGQLRSEGVNFPDIARAFGITKERARQIAFMESDPLHCSVCKASFSTDEEKRRSRTRKFNVCDQCALVQEFNTKAHNFINSNLPLLKLMQNGRDDGYSWTQLTKEYLPKAAGKKYAQRYLPYLREKRAKILQIKEKVNTSHQKFLLYSDENLK